MKKVIVGLVLLLPLFAFAYSDVVGTYSFYTNLRYGMEGKDVLALQRFLEKEGLFFGPFTGGFYTLTQRAVITFQKRENIAPAVGFFGPITRARAMKISIDKHLPSAASSNEFGKSEFQIRSGETVTTSKGTKITLEHIYTDSCHGGSVCARFRVQGDIKTEPINLALSLANTIHVNKVGSEVIMIRTISPFPEQGLITDQDDYLLTFTVEPLISDYR